MTFILHCCSPCIIYHSTNNCILPLLISPWVHYFAISKDPQHLLREFLLPSCQHQIQALPQRHCFILASLSFADSQWCSGCHALLWLLHDALPMCKHSALSEAHRRPPSPPIIHWPQVVCSVTAVLVSR